MAFFAGFHLIQVRNFLDQETCERIIAEIRNADAAPATVYTDNAASGAVSNLMRKATRAFVSQETDAFIKNTLIERKGPLEEHFKISISECEEPQFLHYNPGDYFVAHQDGNTGMLQFDRERIRIVSVIIFLNNQSENGEWDTYTGGDFVLHKYDWGGGSGNTRMVVRAEAGTLVAFPSETTHEVTPVTTGERYSIACWYR